MSSSTRRLLSCSDGYLAERRALLLAEDPDLIHYLLLISTNTLLRTSQLNLSSVVLFGPNVNVTRSLIMSLFRIKLTSGLLHCILT